MTSLPEPTQKPVDRFPSGARPLLVLMLAVVVSATTLYLVNEDFYWYLACGRAIVEEGRIPASELFLFPIEGEPIWLWHSWGWTVFMAVLDDWAGLEAALALGTLFAAAMVFRIFTRAPLDRFGVANAALTLLVVWTAGRRLSHKSEIVSWCLFAFFVHVFDRKSPLTWRRVVILILILLVWSNTHGGYLLGHALLLAFAGDRVYAMRGSGFLARLRFSLSPRKPAIWLGVGFAGVLFASPTATILRDHAPLVLRTTVERGPQDLILEFRRTFSDDLHALMRSDIRFKYLLFLGLGAGSFVWARAPRSTYRLLVFLGMAVLGHRAVRFVHGFGIASVLIAMPNFAQPAPWVLAIGRRIPRGRFMAILHGSVAVALGLGLMAVCVGHWTHRAPMEVGQSRDQLATVDPTISCPGAADYILEHELSGPIFNDMLLGGYLIHRLYPKHKLFIDSRNMSYDLLREYLALCTSEEEWARGQSKYGFRTVVLSNLDMKSATSVLREQLAADPDWSVTYLDPQAAVFVHRAAPSVQQVVSAFDVEGLPERTPFVPDEESGTAGTLLSLGRLGTIDERPFLYRYLVVLGVLGEDSIRMDVASRALELRPDNDWLRVRRAEASFNLGRHAQAIEDITWLLSRPESAFSTPDLLFWRARSHAALGRSGAALADTRALLIMQPDYPGASQLERQLVGRGR